MAKRKAEEVGNGSVATARRRSGRHGASIVADTVSPDKTIDSKRVKADKPVDGAKAAKAENTARPAGKRGRNVKVPIHPLCSVFTVTRHNHVI